MLISGGDLPSNTVTEFSFTSEDSINNNDSSLDNNDLSRDEARRERTVGGFFNRLAFIISPNLRYTSESMKHSSVATVSISPATLQLRIGLRFCHGNRKHSSW